MVNSYMNKVGLTLSRTTNQIKIGEKIPVVFLSSFFRFDFFPKDPKPHPQVWLVTVLLQLENIFYYKYFIVYSDPFTFIFSSELFQTILAYRTLLKFIRHHGFHKGATNTICRINFVCGAQVAFSIIGGICSRCHHLIDTANNCFVSLLLLHLPEAYSFS